MNEFMMIFRSAPSSTSEPSPEQMQESIQQWQNWIGGIAAQDKFVSTNRLGFEGKTLKPDDVVVDGPYAEVKEFVGGYLIVQADSIDEAIKMAEGCPILDIGGHVEVRNILSIND